MKTITVKTNIMCGACIEKVTPFLDKLAGHENWKVDILQPHKPLTVVASDELTEEEVIRAVEDAGYKASH